MIRTHGRRTQLAIATRQSPGVVEPQIKRQVIVLAQEREEAGLEKRRLAEAGLAEEDGERFAADEPGELVGLPIPAEEELALALGEGFEAGPGVAVGFADGTLNFQR